MSKRERHARPATVWVSVQVPGKYRGLVRDVGHKLVSDDAAGVAARLKKALRGEEEEIESTKLTYPDSLKRWHDGWPKFWERFGVEVTDADLVLPPYRHGFNGSIVEPAGLTNSRVYAFCGQEFACWRYQWNNLDVIQPANELGQRVENARVVLVRDTEEEPDQEWLGKSAEFIWLQKIPVLTIRKRMILELRFSLETSRHMDSVNWVICAGSRDPDGDVPVAGWDPFINIFKMDGASSVRSHSGFGVREAVLGPVP